MVISKSKLAIILSQLDVFENPELKLEQYSTDSEIAADMLNFAMLKGDIMGKTIADLGCGTGILGIGALFQNAKYVYFVDKDKNAIELLKKNLSKFNFKNFKIIRKDITSLSRDDFAHEIDVAIQNPPFGTKEKHADKTFLETAFRISDIIYSFHKSSTTSFVDVFCKDNDFRITNKLNYKFPLKNTMPFHHKKIQKIDVTCFRIERNT